DFFPLRPKVNPTIYAYELPEVGSHKGWLKIGYTDRNARIRIKEQLGTAAIRYKIVYEGSAMRQDGSAFTDHEVHRRLLAKGIAKPEGEWFVCKVNDLRKAVYEIKTGERTEDNRVLDFPMRPEQKAAVEKTKRYFLSCKEEASAGSASDKAPQFLWNAKMSCEKTFTSYQLAKSIDGNKVL